MLPDFLTQNHPKFHSRQIFPEVNQKSQETQEILAFGFTPDFAKKTPALSQNPKILRKITWSGNTGPPTLEGKTCATVYSSLAPAIELIPSLSTGINNTP